MLPRRRAPPPFLVATNQPFYPPVGSPAPLAARRTRQVDSDGRAGYRAHEGLALVSSQLDVRLLGPLRPEAVAADELIGEPQASDHETRRSAAHA